MTPPTKQPEPKLTKLEWTNHGMEPESDRKWTKFYLASDADALIAQRDVEIARLREALEKCQSVFNKYATLHFEKDTIAGNEKGRANNGLAQMCANALTQPPCE